MYWMLHKTGLDISTTSDEWYINLKLHPLLHISIQLLPVIATVRDDYQASKPSLVVQCNI